jgi:hypothetical protein
MTTCSSDLSINSSGSVRAAFECDEAVVKVQFYSDTEKIGPLFSFTRAEAIKVGKDVAITGLLKGFPVSGILISDIKNFGLRLGQYGENGC